MRIVEVITDVAHGDTLVGLAEQHGATDCWWGSENEDGRRSFRILVDDGARQAVVDALQNLLGAVESTRILILPVDASLPRPKEEDDEGGKRRAVAATREEIYNQVAKEVRPRT
jgi:hypothetical protein